MTGMRTSATKPNVPVEDILSARELEVYSMIGDGLITKQIAAKLKLSPKTIETHREKIKTKLNLANASQLLRSAVLWKAEKDRQHEQACAAIAPNM